jgi:hypothetical protein
VGLKTSTSNHTGIKRHHLISTVLGLIDQTAELIQD